MSNFLKASGNLRLAVLAFLLAASAPLFGESGITLLPLSAETAFPDAVAPNALQFACADDADQLASFFGRKRLLFSPTLMAPRGGHAFCHIFYEPTVRGYRATPDSRPVQSLFVAVDPMSFIVRRKPDGDSLSIAKQVLPQLDRPLDVTISVAGNFDPELWPEALKFHFGESKHRFEVRKSGAISSHPWAQDHQKAGEVDGKLRILVPRRLFEGRREDGEVFGPMLDKLDGPIFERSKLSWEGGDLQFARDPKAPSRIILLHGGVGRYYWGEALSGAEVSYVLLTEFGADLAIDVTPTTMHADYAVAFLPAEGAALVAQSVTDSPQLFRAAAEVLRRLCGEHPPPALLDLQRFLEDWDDDLAASASALRGCLRGLERAFATYTYPEDPAIDAELTAFVDAHCDGDAPACFQGDNKKRMLALAPDLLRRSSGQSADIALFELATTRMLGVMEAQLPRPRVPRELALDGVANTLQEFGFRVIRTPYIYAPQLHDEWSGLSYANSFVDGRKVFMPALGLGALESELFADIQQRLGAGYQVIPVNARSSILNNGGAHCVFGIVREPMPVPTLSE